MHKLCDLIIFSYAYRHFNQLLFNKPVDNAGKTVCHAVPGWEYVYLWNEMKQPQQQQELLQNSMQFHCAGGGQS